MDGLGGLTQVRDIRLLYKGSELPNWRLMNIFTDAPFKKLHWSIRSDHLRASLRPLVSQQRLHRNLVQVIEEVGPTRNPLSGLPSYSWCRWTPLREMPPPLLVLAGLGLGFIVHALQSAYVLRETSCIPPACIVARLGLTAVRRTVTRCSSQTFAVLLVRR